MSTISLEKAIRTCKVDTAWAPRLESDRFLNPNTMVCPAWNGVDTAGRPVSSNSFNTKNAGCNSASDRVLVENDLRPQYIEYVTLDASGIRGDRSCPQNNNINPDTQCHQDTIKKTHAHTGQFGMVSGFSSQIMPNCLSCNNYPDSRAVSSQQLRNNQFIKEGFIMRRNKERSGFGRF